MPPAFNYCMMQNAIASPLAAPRTLPARVRVVGRVPAKSCRVDFDPGERLLL